MSIFKNIFTWWEGATFGTALKTMTRGDHVGTDALGNRYFQSKKPESGQTRRWVMYDGSNDSSRIPAIWHSWLHGTIDVAPDSALASPALWVKSPTPNLTGTGQAYKPAGALEMGGARAGATGDYEAWSPDAA